MRRAFAAPLLLLAATAGARDVPYLAGRVNDTANLLAAEQATAIERRLAELEQSTGAQVAVLTIDSLDGEPVEDYAVRVAETWKLGQQGADNGVLFLIARDDRKMRLEVGYGLEGQIPDAIARRILDNVVRPHFKAGDFGAGIAAGADAIAGALRGDAPPAEAPVSGSNELGDAPLLAKLLGMLVFSVVIGIFSLLALFGKGCQSWFLYLFLIPFWGAFPAAFFGPAGLLALGAWLVGFPIAKLWLGRTGSGKAFLAAHPALATFAASSGRSSGSSWSSGGSSWSSGGFSGGGGSFGGGGASSSW